MRSEEPNPLTPFPGREGGTGPHRSFSPFPSGRGAGGVGFCLLLLALPACAPRPGASTKSDEPKPVPVTVAEAKSVSLRRMVSPHDVAAMVLFLLSPMGDNLSGQSLGVDGNVETL